MVKIWISMEEGEGVLFPSRFQGTGEGHDPLPVSGTCLEYVLECARGIVLTITGAVKYLRLEV